MLSFAHLAGTPSLVLLISLLSAPCTAKWKSAQIETLPDEALPHMLPGCELRYRPFSEVPEAKAIWWDPGTQANPITWGLVKSGSALNRMHFITGVDLVPSKHDQYATWKSWPFPTFPSAVDPDKQRQRVPTPDGELLIGECSYAAGDSVWHTARVGPLSSTGGFDTFMLNWRDVEIADRIRQNGEYFTGFMLTFVDEDGNHLSSPGELHDHHSSMVIGKPGDDFVPLTYSAIGCMLGVTPCMDRSSTINAAGFDPTQSVMRHCQKPRVGESLSFSRQVNDPRPFGSPPRVFYVQYSARSAPKCLDDDRIISYHAISALNHGYDKTEEWFFFKATRTPLFESTYMYLQARLPIAGSFDPVTKPGTYAQYHTHGINCRAYYMIPETVEALGLPELRTIPMHFGSVEERDIFESRLQERYMPCKMVLWNRSVSDADRTAHDVIPGAQACKAWKWEAGQVLTTVILFGGARPDEKPGLLIWPQHMTLNIRYEAADGEAHLTNNYAGIILDDMDPLTSPFDTIRISICTAPEQSPCKLNLKKVLSIPAYLPLILVAIGFVCCTRRRYALCCAATIIEAVVAVAAYGYYQTRLHTFDGNEIDRAAIRPPPDYEQLILLLLPAFFTLLLVVLCKESTPVVATAKKMNGELL